MAGCDQLNGIAPTSLSPRSVLSSCKKAVDGKDIKTAAKDCPFAEQWLERQQPDSVLHAEALETLGDLLAQVNANAAAGNYQQALTLREKQADKAVPLEGLQLKLANSLGGSGKWADAEKVLHQIKPAQGMESLEGADILNRLGVAQLQQKLLTNAEQSLRQALAIREAKLNATDAALGETYSNLAFLYLSAGKNQDAESYYRKAVSNQESAKDIPYSALYDSLSNLAALLQKDGKLQDAEAALQKLLTAAEKGFGKESVQYAAGLNSLGMLGMSVRNYAASEKLFNDSLSIREKILGVNHLLTAESANNLAVALANQGKRAQALPLMRHAAAVTNVALGASNPLTQQRWNSLLQLEGSVANKRAPTNLTEEQQTTKPGKKIKK
jgi:tetratricopeptide (TPR) repeat protein